MRIHLERLVAMEYVRLAAGQRFEYELLFDGDLGATAPQMIGLIAVTALRGDAVDTTATSQGEVPDVAPGLQAARTELAPASQGEQSDGNASADVGS